MSYYLRNVTYFPFIVHHQHHHPYEGKREQVSECKHTHCIFLHGMVSGNGLPQRPRLVVSFACFFSRGERKNLGYHAPVHTPRTGYRAVVFHEGKWTTKNHSRCNNQKKTCEFLQHSHSFVCFIGSCELRKSYDFIALLIFLLIACNPTCFPSGEQQRKEKLCANNVNQTYSFYLTSHNMVERKWNEMKEWGMYSIPR